MDQENYESLLETLALLSTPGILKSIKIDGSKSIEGEIKVYVENDNVRYLIFDSSQLVEKRTGIFGITGFVTANKTDKNLPKKIKNDTPVNETSGGNSNENANATNPNNQANNPPVWKSDVEEFIINGVTSIDLDDFYSDKNNDSIYYSVSIPDNIEVSLNNNLLILTPLDNNFNTSINIKEAAAVTSNHCKSCDMKSEVNPANKNKLTLEYHSTI